MKGIRISWRLTLWYTATLATALLITGLAVYFGTDASFDRVVLQQLARRARTLQVEVAGPPQDRGAQEVGGRASTSPASPTSPDLLTGLEGGVAQITGPGGAVMNRSAKLAGPGLPADLPLGRLTLVPLNGAVFAASAFPLQPPAGPQLRLQLALPWGPSADALDELQHLLWLVGSAASLLALAGGYLLAHAALGRVDRIRGTAERIGSTAGLDERLPLRGPGDELDRLAEAFNAMLDRLAAASRAQNEFVANASHELRTPVAVIRGHAAMLRRWAAEDPEALAESLEVIERQSHHLGRLVTNLLVLVNQAATSAFEPRPVDLVQLAAELLAQTAVLCGGRRMTAVAPGPALVLGDETLLRELLTALLDNAVRFTGPGGRIEVRVASSASQVRLEVEDDGVGIAAEDVPHVFERFYRSAEARRSAPGGSGLGLAIATEVVRRHGGTIGVASEPGRGTCIAVTLPAAREETGPSGVGWLPAVTPALPLGTAPVDTDG